VEAGLALKVNGKAVTTEEVKGLAGTSFELQVGDNFISFHALTDGGIKLTLNGKSSESLNIPLHLDISSKAVCIGESCMMWPKSAASTTLTPHVTFPGHTASVSPLEFLAPVTVAPLLTDEEFIQNIKKQLGDANYERLVGIFFQKNKARTISRPLRTF